MVIIKQYKEENYSVIFNQETGALARIEQNGYKEPSYSKHGPELLDISISNWCDKGCLFCYRNSNRSGNYISIQDYKNLLVQAKECDVFQVALGGGNPNQHPSFAEILKTTREYNIIPSYTTNGRGLTEEVLRASKEYCGAVAVSYYPGDDFYIAINKLTEMNIKTNIHFLMSSESIKTAISWLKEPPSFLEKINAIIFLNYKPVGKLKNEKLLLKNSPNIGEFFKWISKNNYSFKFGFDSCTISYISNFIPNIDERFVESCEAGKFSAFIDENSKLYPCSFMMDKVKGINLKQTSLKEAWALSEEFRNMREEEFEEICNNCSSLEICRGGCRIFKEINNNCR